VNKDLYGQEFEVPKHIVDILRNAVAKYSNQSVENVKRAKELSETGKGTYQQLKRIKNWFDSNGNTSSPEYHILGGGTLKNWIDTTLDSARESKRLPKQIKSDAAISNKFISTHEKNNDLRTDFRPSHSHKKRSQRIAGISEEIEQINNWFKTLLI
jgi:hypothetical protein